MPTSLHYLETNRQSWNNRTEAHLKSEFYDLDGFLNGKSSLNDIELALLGDVGGNRILHLQCHFGQDTISLSRLGAAGVTGVDLADKAIESARRLAEETGAAVDFICCNVYDLPEHLDAQFDIVFTSYGVIGWLPDLDKWAAVVSRFLRPNGKLVLVEFHPVVWMFDDRFEKIQYSYFNDGPIVETEQGTYADRSADLVLESVTWNHSMSEVINSLVQHGMEIRLLDEWDYSPYNCFQNTVEIAPNKYRIAHLGNKIPMVYAVVATKAGY